jgi:hypothetical protein
MKAFFWQLCCCCLKMPFRLLNCSVLIVCLSSVTCSSIIYAKTFSFLYCTTLIWNKMFKNYAAAAASRKMKYFLICASLWTCFYDFIHVFLSISFFFSTGWVELRAKSPKDFCNLFWIILQFILEFILTFLWTF